MSQTIAKPPIKIQWTLQMNHWADGFQNHSSVPHKLDSLVQILLDHHHDQDA